jgi:hypothetical protein
MAMNWLRSRLRKWLEKDLPAASIWNRLVAFENDAALRLVNLDDRANFLKERNRLAWDRIVAIEQLHSEISKKQAHLDAVLIEVRQLRELLQDPKRTPVIAKTFHQYRALMEQD